MSETLHGRKKEADLDGRVIGALAALLTAKLCLYLLITPPWQVPDEPTHFEYAYLLYRESGLLSSVAPDPVLQREILESMWEFRFWDYLPWPPPEEVPETFVEAPFLQGAPSQLHRSQPLYYLLGAVWLRLFSPSGIVEALYLLRAYSALLILSFFVLATVIVRWALPGRGDLQLAALCFIVFLPQLGAIGAGVNSDNAIVLFYTLVVFLCAWTVRRNRKILPFLVLLPAVLLCVLSKRTGIVAIPLALWTLYLSFQWRRQTALRVAYATLAVLAVFAIAQATLTWVNPDTARKVVASVAFGWRQLAGADSFGRGETLMAISLLWQSFWGRFGWLTVGAPQWVYLPHLAALGLVVWGSMRTLSSIGEHRSHERFEHDKTIGLIVSASGLLVLVAVLLRNLGDFQPQGRYLLPGILAFAVWFSVGAERLALWIPRPLALAGPVIWMAMFESVLFVRYSIAGFSGPMSIAQS